MANFLSFPRSSKSSVVMLIVFVLAFDLAFVGQKLGGAYQNEFGAHPHEASHFMSGLYWRDFVLAWRSGAEGNSQPTEERMKEFAREYEAHYPRVETGAGGSLFDGLEAIWMVAFPAKRGSLLVLMALVSAVAATQLFRVLQREYGLAGAGLAAAALLVLAPMRVFAGVTMPDLLSLSLVFGAAMAFGDFLDREKNSDAILAGVLGGLAILNDESRSDVWVVLLIAWAMSRKFTLIGKPIVWGMVALILAAIALRENWPMAEGSVEAVWLYLSRLGNAVGWPLVALMVIGLFVKFGRRGEFSGRWLAAGALLIDLLTSRSLSQMLPAVLMFALAGGAWLTQWVATRITWGGNGARVRVAFAGILGVLGLLSAAGSWAKEPCTGFAPLAETLIQDSAPGGKVLVSSTESGEERFIAELAVREQRPGHVVLCGTHTLAKPGKKLISNETVFPSDEAVFEFLNSEKIEYVVLDDAIPDEDRREHHYQIRRAIEEHLDRCWVIASCPVTRDGVVQSAPVKLYKIRGIN